MPTSSGSALGTKVSRETASLGRAAAPGTNGVPATAGNEVSRETCALGSAADPSLCPGASRPGVPWVPAPAADAAGSVPAEATAIVAFWPSPNPGPVSRETGTPLGVRNASSTGRLEPPRGSRGQPSPPSGTPKVSSGQPSPEGAPLDDVMGVPLWIEPKNCRADGGPLRAGTGPRHGGNRGCVKGLNRPGTKQRGTLRTERPTYPVPPSPGEPACGRCPSAPGGRSSVGRPRSTVSPPSGG